MNNLDVDLLRKNITDAVTKEFGQASVIFTSIEDELIVGTKERSVADFIDREFPTGSGRFAVHINGQPFRDLPSH